MNESQRLKIEEAANDDYYAGNGHDRARTEKEKLHFIAGAEFALKMVEEEPETLESLCNKKQRELDCVCHETNSRNCPVHQNWSRERDGSGV